MRIAVFCSVSPTVSPLFFGEIEQVGELLAEMGLEVVYGGANIGCMGALARGVLRKQGRLIGVVPQLDFMDGVVQEGMAEQHVVQTLSERKTLMNELSDAYLVYPGGLGTLDEALEVMALKASGNLPKPIYFYNFLDVWTPFLAALSLLVEQNMIHNSIADLVQVLDKPSDLRENLTHALRSQQST